MITVTAKPKPLVQGSLNHWNRVSWYISTSYVYTHTTMYVCICIYAHTNILRIPSTGP